MEHLKSPHNGQNHNSRGNFWQMFSQSGDSVWSNFGTNGQDAVVLLPSEALIFLSIAVYQK